MRRIFFVTLILLAAFVSVLTVSPTTVQAVGCRPPLVLGRDALGNIACVMPLPPTPPPLPVTSFNPNDGSMSRAAGDRLALWCNVGATPPNLDVWGITNGKGSRLVQVNYAALPKPGSQTFDAGANGTVTIWIAANGTTISIKWQDTSGQSIASKQYSCPFKQ